MTIPRLGLGLLLMIVGVCGCAARPEPTSPTPPAFQLFQMLPPIDAVENVTIYLTGPDRRHFAVIDKDGRLGETLIRMTSPTDEHDSTQSETEVNREIEYRRTEADGRVVMPAHLDVKEGALSLFSPPLVLAPRELKAGEKHSSEAAMRIVDSNNPLKVKETGAAKRTIEYVGDQRLRTPMGEFIAKRVEVIFAADLRLADAEDRITMFIVPEQGVIAEQSQRKVKVLGAFTSTQTRTIVRMPD